MVRLFRVRPVEAPPEPVRRQGRTDDTRQHFGQPGRRPVKWLCPISCHPAPSRDRPAPCPACTGWTHPDRAQALRNTFTHPASPCPQED